MINTDCIECSALGFTCAAHAPRGVLFSITIRERTPVVFSLEDKARAHVRAEIGTFDFVDPSTGKAIDDLTQHDGATLLEIREKPCNHVIASKGRLAGSAKIIRATRVASGLRFSRE